MIPKIIWQQYETDFNDLPKEIYPFIETWKKNNPKWEYRYMSKNDRRNFILKNYGKEWLDIFDGYTLNALRTDLWRYLVLYKFGGLYVDLDITCNASVENWIMENDQFVISAEPGYTDLTQMIMASTPEHPLLKKILDNIKSISIYNIKNNIKYENRVEYNRLTTGYTIITNSIIDFLKLPTNFNFEINDYRVYNSKAKEFGINIYRGEGSRFMFEKMIKHHHAGQGTLWDGYTAWFLDDWEDGWNKNV